MNTSQNLKPEISRELSRTIRNCRATDPA